MDQYIHKHRKHRLECHHMATLGGLHQFLSLVAIFRVLQNRSFIEMIPAHLACRASLNSIGKKDGHISTMCAISDNNTFHSIFRSTLWVNILLIRANYAMMAQANSDQTYLIRCSNRFKIGC
jgi:hypothetical protein